MKFVLGSTSERKIIITQKILSEYFKDCEIIVEGCSAVSGVPDTPWDDQTWIGAKNRVLDARSQIIGADYYLGLESGLVERYGHIYEEAWCIIITADGKEFSGYSSGLKVPDYVLHKMDKLHMEHSEVMTILEKEHGKLPNDTWGSYSGGILLREVSLGEAIRNALIQIISPENSFYNK